MYDHWFVSRQKRRLTQVLPALVAYSDVCLGKKWNPELQLVLEDELAKRDITAHGNLRARKAGQGGGGIRTLFKQMKDLGLVFLEDENKHCQLTLVGESLVKGDVSFVDAMRMQLQKYQYPSAACWSGTGSVSHDFKVHPFQFMFRLLRDARLEDYLTMDEMRYIVIHYANSDSDECFEDVVARILRYRETRQLEYEINDSKKTYWNIANTFFNYISLTQYVDRIPMALLVRYGKAGEIDAFVQEKPRFIPRPELTENYLRAYGRGNAAKDLRDFKDSKYSQKEINNSRIRKEYVLLALRTPITGITPDVVQHISMSTGIDEKTVEGFLIHNYPHGNIDDFFASYKELAHMGTEGAADFEIATCEMFKKIFGMNAKRVGQIGNTPDVYVESAEAGYCGIIDNKAYKDGYSISGDHKRRMEDEYIPTVQKYGGSSYPLAFFSYISGSFGKSIDHQIEMIHQDTGVHGSAMPVDILIDIAQNYAEQGYSHETLKEIFSVDREVRLSDCPRHHSGAFQTFNASYAMAAEESAVFTATKNK